MSYHKKIHPVNDPEAPPHPPTYPTALNMPCGPGKSPPQQQPRGTGPYQPLRQPNKRKRSCCCRSVCYTLCALLLLVVVLGATVGILYLAFNPKIPKYSIDRLELTRLTLNQNSRLSVTFNVTITAKNPNKKIGIYYEDGSKISVWYAQTKLSEGSLPKFYQCHENTTVLYIEMTGQTDDTVGLISTLQQQQFQTGNIPLRVKVNQPVRVKVGKVKLMEVRFLVRCGFAVDSLSANDNVIRIQSNGCKIRLRL